MEHLVEITGVGGGDAGMLECRYHTPSSCLEIMVSQISRYAQHKSE